MTEAEYILTDLVIEKMPVHESFDFFSTYHNILHWKHDKFSQPILDELHELINSRSPSIRTFMLDNSYIKVHDARFPKDIADDPGKKAKELGGHQQYLTWKAKQDKQSNWETIPAKRWLTILVLTNLFTAGLPILIGLLQEPKSTKGSQLQQEIQALRDSVQELLHQPKETLYIRQNPLSQSKSDCIK